LYLLPSRYHQLELFLNDGTYRGTAVQTGPDHKLINTRKQTMPKKLLAGLAAALSSMLWLSALQAQPASEAETKTPERPVENVADLEEKSRQAYENEKWLSFYITNMKLHQQRLYEPQYMSNIVRACGRLDRKSTAYHYMLMMQKQGLAHDFNAFEDTVSIRNTEAYRYINDLLIRARDPAGSAEIFTKLAVSAADVQAAAWDRSRKRLLIGTESQGRVLAVAGDGSVETLLDGDREKGLWSVRGLAVDPERDRLWVSSSATPAFSGFDAQDSNRGGLLEFDLKSLELLNRYELPADELNHELGGLALTADGQVYVIDRAQSVLYRKPTDGQTLHAFVSVADLDDFRDIAVTPDNSRIFISDAFKGVLVIDPAAEQTAMLSGTENISLGRIEGIEYHDGELYALQSGIDPDRLVRLQLDATGSKVTGITPVASAMPEFDGPGALTLDAGRFYFVANRNGDDSPEAILMQTTVEAGRDAVSTEMQKAQDDFQSRQP
jgi:hypothetical protein